MLWTNEAEPYVAAAKAAGLTDRVELTTAPFPAEPDAALLARAQANAKVTLHRDPKEAIEGAQVVNTDVWASMGHEEERRAREKAFAGFCVDSKLMAGAAADAIFLHCLPAHRGEEVSAEVIDGKQSVVWDEAENRLHVQRAIMAAVIGGERLA